MLRRFVGVEHVALAQHLPKVGFRSVLQGGKQWQTTANVFAQEGKYPPDR